MKIGQSQDIHRLVEGRDLILGGIKIPFDKGPLGHSDGDALTHAITEAIIGAMGLGDLGTFFPDNDPKYKDINSLELLKEIGDLMISKGYRICNIDSLIVIEKPKMRPYIEMIKESLANTLGINKELINVKATTYEKMGEIGNGEAVLAQAVVLLEEVVNYYES